MARKITIEVEIDPWDVLGDIPTDDLRTELMSRKKPDDVADIRDVIRHANGETAARLERIFFPKFASPAHAQDAYDRAMQEKTA